MLRGIKKREKNVERKGARVLGKKKKTKIVREEIIKCRRHALPRTDSLADDARVRHPIRVPPWP